MNNQTITLRAMDILGRFCLDKNIPCEPIDWDQEDPKVLFVPEEYSENEEELIECIKGTPAHCRTIHVPGGTLLAFSGNIIQESVLSDIQSDVATKYNRFRAKLVEALTSESQYNPPETALQRSDASCQFPDAIQDIRDKNKTRKKKSTKNMDDKINEALEGIATPNDIQPQQGLKSLFSALKKSGLAQELKRGGVSWHVAKPGRHMVTFNKGEVPILQKTSVELADEKELSETLAQLTSIAQGKAPQAAELELNRVKEIAKKAGDRKKALDNIAGQYAVQPPEEAAAAQLQQQRDLRPQPVRPTRPATKQAVR